MGPRPSVGTYATGTREARNLARGEGEVGRRRGEKELPAGGRMLTLSLSPREREGGGVEKFLRGSGSGSLQFVGPRD